MHFNISEGFQQTFHSNLPGINVHFLISTFESYNVLETSLYIVYMYFALHLMFATD